MNSEKCDFLFLATEVAEKVGNPGSGWKSWTKMKEETSAENKEGIRLYHRGGFWIMTAGEAM